MGEKKKENEEGISAFIGVSAPETPKYLLTNNFIAEFFVPDDIYQSYNYDFFEDKGILTCEEDDKETKDKLKRSFDAFFNRFTGYDIIRSRYIKKNYYFPLSPQMIRTSSNTLRHLLINLLSLNEAEYVDMQIRLEEYLFNSNSGANYVLSEICSNISTIDQIRKKYNQSDSFVLLRKKKFFKKISSDFKEDLNTLLTHKYFIDLDFYKKYEYLSTLLTSYVVQFILRRKEKESFILCKGSATESRLNSGELHRACVNNYTDIRSVFPDLLREFYISKLDRDSQIIVKLDGDEILVNNQPLIKFVKDVFESSGIKNKEEFYKNATKIFKLENDGVEKYYQRDEFVICYIDMTKSRSGSSLTKISSTLPTSGREMGIVFPTNSVRHKYFAMSNSLAEFYVRFYLSSINEEYAYLDDFIRFLELKYNIYIVKSDEMVRRIKSYHTKVSMHEFKENEEAFLATLRSINCLVKLSDSGYVITLPEMKGDFKLL